MQTTHLIITIFSLFLSTHLGLAYSGFTAKHPVDPHNKEVIMAAEYALTEYNKKGHNLHFINVVSGTYEKYPTGIIRYDLIITTKVNPGDPHVLYEAVVDLERGTNPIMKLISFSHYNKISSFFEFVDEFMNA